LGSGGPWLGSGHHDPTLVTTTGRGGPKFPRVASVSLGLFIFSRDFFDLCCYFSFKEDEPSCKKGKDSIVLETILLTQTPLKRLEEGEKGSSESNSVEAKSKYRHSSF